MPTALEKPDMLYFEGGDLPQRRDFLAIPEYYSRRVLTSMRGC